MLISHQPLHMGELQATSDYTHTHTQRTHARTHTYTYLSPNVQKNVQNGGNKGVSF